MDVLLVIDMQKSMFLTPRLNTDSVVSNINSLARFIRQNGGVVLYVQHNGTVEEGLAEGTQGWEIIDELDVQADDMKMTKTACDAFYETNLATILTGLKADNVVITGAATEFCVDTTLRSCLSKGFNLTAIADAHTTADREHLSARSIVEHHNWTWANLILPEVDIKVVTTADWIGTH